MNKKVNPIKVLERKLYYYSMEAENKDVPYILNIQENTAIRSIEDQGNKYYFYSCKSVKNSSLWVVKYYKVLTGSLTAVGEREELITGEIGVPIILIIDPSLKIGESGLGVLGLSPYRGAGRSKTLLQQIFNIIQNRTDPNDLDFPPIQKHVDTKDIEKRRIAKLEYDFGQSSREDMTDLELPEGGTVIGDCARQIAKLYGGAEIKIIVSRGRKRDLWLSNIKDFLSSGNAAKLKVENKESQKIEMLDLLDIQETSILKIQYPRIENRPDSKRISDGCIEEFLRKRGEMVNYLKELNIS